MSVLRSSSYWGQNVNLLLRELASLPTPLIPGIAIAVAIVVIGWAITDCALAKSDKRESAKLAKDIEEAYKKMGKKP